MESGRSRKKTPLIVWPNRVAADNLMKYSISGIKLPIIKPFVENNLRWFNLIKGITMKGCEKVNGMRVVEILKRQ
jgi:hypothetical protein